MIALTYSHPKIISQQDYLPFGLQYNRNGGSAEDQYRYGFNGKEKDVDGEWGDLTHYDYGFRIYNPGIAKFLSIDPLAPGYPFLSPYCYAANNPILFIDKDGAGPTLPPLYDPRGIFHVVRASNPELYDAFGRAQNSSLSHVQKAAWYTFSHTSRTNWSTIFGVTGEVSVLETLKSQDVIHPIVAHRKIKESVKALGHGQINIHYAHAPDKFTDILQRVTGASPSTPYIFGFDRIGSTLFGSPVIATSPRREKYTKYTQFVFEVKSVSARRDNLVDILLFGIDDQLLNNARVTDGGALPVLIADRDAMNTALQSDRGEEVMAGIQRLEAAGGGLFTIDGLNKRTAKSLRDFLSTIRESTDAVPESHYRQ